MSGRAHNLLDARRSQVLHCLEHVGGEVRWVTLEGEDAECPWASPGSTHDGQRLTGGSHPMWAVTHGGGADERAHVRGSVTPAEASMMVATAIDLYGERAPGVLP